MSSSEMPVQTRQIPENLMKCPVVPTGSPRLPRLGNAGRLCRCSRNDRIPIHPKATPVSPGGLSGVRAEGSWYDPQTRRFGQEDMTTASVEEQMRVLMRGVEYGDPHIQATMEEELRAAPGRRPAAARLLRLRPHGGRPAPRQPGADAQDAPVPALRPRGHLPHRHDDRHRRRPHGQDGAARRCSRSEQVRRNAETWLRQAYRVLDPSARRASSATATGWRRMTLADMVGSWPRTSPCEQFLEHETFRKRHRRGRAAVHARVHLRPDAGLRRPPPQDGRAGRRRRPALQHHGRPPAAAGHGRAAAGRRD